MNEKMTDAQYAQADEELFAMLGDKKPTGRKTVGVVISMKRAKQLNMLEELLFQLSDLLPIAGWAGAALLFLGATVFGWMAPIFGSIVAVFTFAVAAYRFWRLRHHQKRRCPTD